MSATLINRDTANSLNPFVGDGVADTLDRCASVIAELGYLHSSLRMDAQFQQENLFRIFEAITVAMRFESNRLAAEAAESHSLNDAAPDMLEALRYLRNCIESGTAPAMSRVNAAIRRVPGTPWQRPRWPMRRWRAGWRMPRSCTTGAGSPSRSETRRRPADA